MQTLAHSAVATKFVWDQTLAGVAAASFQPWDVRLYPWTPRSMLLMNLGVHALSLSWSRRPHAIASTIQRASTVRMFCLHRHKNVFNITVMTDVVLAQNVSEIIEQPGCFWTRWGSLQRTQTLVGFKTYGSGKENGLCERNEKEAWDGRVRDKKSTLVPTIRPTVFKSRRPLVLYVVPHVKTTWLGHRTARLAAICRRDVIVISEISCCRCDCNRRCTQLAG